MLRPLNGLVLRSALALFLSGGGGIFLVSGHAIVLGQIDEVPTAQLVQRLTDSDSDTRRDAIYELVRRRADSDSVIEGFTKSLSDRDDQIVFQALLGLARAGGVSEPATEQLLSKLNDRGDQVRYRAGDALAKIGPSILPRLIDYWRSASTQAKRELARTFTTLGSTAKSAEPLLLESLGNGDGSLQRYAAEALVAISPDDEPQLLTLANHANDEVRRVGILALSNLVTPTELTKDKLEQSTRDVEPSVRETAIIAMAKSNISASEKARFLEAALMDEADAVRAAAIVGIRKAKLNDEEFAVRIAKRFDDAQAASANAILQALADMGDNGKAALPAILIAAQRNLVDQNLAAQTIAGFGADSVQPLLSELEKQPSIAPIVSRALAIIGNAASDVLLEAMSSEHEVARVTAAGAIGRMRPLNSTLLERLANALQDASPLVRSTAIRSLLVAGQDSAFAKKRILSLAEDQNSEVRAAAVMVISVFEFSDEEISNVLKNALADSEPAVRSSALAALSTSSTMVDRFASNLVQVGANDADASVRREAMGALSKLSKDRVTPAVTKAVVATLLDSDRAVKLQATEAVMNLGLRDKEILAALSSNLTDDAELLNSTLLAVAEYGGDASELIPVASQLISHPATSVRVAALRALAKIQSDKHALAGRLCEALSDSEWEVRRSAAETLSSLGEDAKVAVPKLFTMLSVDEDSDIANSALREINTAPSSAVKLLIENLGSEDRKINFYAISFLGKIGPDASEALPQLKAMLEDVDSDDRRSEFRQKLLRDAIKLISGEQTNEADQT